MPTLFAALLTPVAQCIDQQRKRRRMLAPARVVEVVARKRRAPVFEHPPEQTFGEIGLRQVQGGGGGPEFLSTHPSSGSRIKDLQANVPRVMPFYKPK